MVGLTSSGKRSLPSLSHAGGLISLLDENEKELKVFFKFIIYIGKLICPALRSTEAERDGG